MGISKRLRRQEPDPVTERHQDAGSDKVPDGAQRDGRQAAPVFFLKNDQEQAEKKAGQNDLVLGDQAQAKKREKEPIVFLQQEKEGQSKEEDRQRFRVVLVEVHVLQGRIEQKGEGDGQRRPVPFQPFAGVEEDRERRQGQENRLHDVQHIDAVPEPEERGDKKTVKRNGVAELVQAAHGHERGEAAGEEPDPLVVNTGVKSLGGKSGLQQDRIKREDKNIIADRQPQQAEREAAGVLPPEEGQGPAGRVLVSGDRPGQRRIRFVHRR